MRPPAARPTRERVHRNRPRAVILPLETFDLFLLIRASHDQSASMTNDFEMPDFSPEAIVLAWRAGSLEALIHDVSLELEDEPWKAWVATVISLHRSGEIDLLATASRTEGPINYLVERLYSEAFPELEASVTEMMAVASALIPRSRDGNLPYFMYDAFSNWARRDASRVEDAFAAIRAGTAPPMLLIATLQSGLHVDRASYLPIVASLLAKGTEEEVRTAGFVLGTAAADAHEERLIKDSLAEAWISGNASRRIAGFSAALSIGTRDAGDETIAIAAIDTIQPNDSPEIRQPAARALFLARGRLSEPLVIRICTLLGGVEVGEAETIEAINHAIAQHLSGATAAPRLALLENMLRRGVADLKAMDDTAHYILTDKGQLLNELVTAWIADGSDPLIQAVHDLVTIPASRQPITFDLDFTDHGLSAERSLAAGRKVVSSLILFPVTAVSILLSMMRTGHPGALEELEELLFDPLLISYWEGPREYLDGLWPSSASALQERITRVVARLDAYIAAIRETGVIRELGQRFLQEVLRLEERRKIEKSVRKKSVFADLFATRVVLYGDSVVSEVFRSDGEGERQEFRMGTVEHSMPLARLDAIDPFGFWYQRVLLSMGKAP